MKKILILALVLVICACAPKTSQPPSETDESKMGQLWDKMQAIQGHTTPYRIQFSLRYGSAGDTRRVTALLWGNNDDQLRLDIMAGVGAILAKIAQAGDNFLLFPTQDKKAFFHDGSNRPLLNLGGPLPFTLSQLADLLNGRFGEIFGKQYQSTSLDGKKTVYELEGRAAGKLVLNKDGLPIQWLQNSGNWRMELDYEKDSSLPTGIKLFNKNGKQAVLLIKERESVEAPFDPEQLRLALPEGTPLLPLSQYKAS